LDCAKLLLLDSFNLETVVLELLSDLLALLEVIESVLLLDVVVLRNLSTHNIGVVSQLVLALLFQFAFLLLVFLLAVNDAEEIVTLGLGLGGESVLTLVEPSLAGNLKISSLILHAHLISDLLLAALAFTLFEGALSTESINLRLSISSFFLHLTETSNLLLLLFLNAAFLESLGNLTLDFFLVVTDNLLLLSELLLSELGLLGEGNLVGGLNFSDQTHVAGTLVISSLDLTLALGFNLARHLFLLLDLLFALLNTLDFSFLNLVDDNHSTLASGLLADNLALLLNLEGLKTLNFHHQVEFLLLLNPLLLEALVLIELFVTDRYNF